LLIERISFALQASARLAYLLCPLNRWIAEKYNGAEQLVSRLLRPACILLNGLPVFGVLPLDALALGHRVIPLDTMR